MVGLRWIRFGGGLFVIGAIVVAFATQARADDQYVGVARISVLNGTVVMQHAESTDKIAAIVNAPVMVGDYVTTGADSRTEIQLDDTNFIRAGAQTQLRLTQLDATSHTVQLAAGTIEVGVLRYPDTHPQVQTPSITVRPLDSGRYRVTVTEAGDTLVTVRSGRADLVTPQGTQTMGAGISVLVSGSASDPRIQNVETIAYDDFDAWNSERDRFTASALAASAVAASSYANSGIVGLADLNSYGRWSYAPAYGSVWIPYGQIAGWSPYHFGRWAWQPYCGWTWVGYEPWGWAPYHYGRWFYQPRYGWAWYPGPRGYPYYWQPALVAFFGFGNGGGFGFNFSFGNVAWVPLAPFEPYNPWWQRGYAGRPIIGYSNTSVTKVNDITRIYRNVGAPGGVAAIHGGDLNGGSRYLYLQVHNGDLRNVALAKSGLPVAPSNVSYRYTTGSGEIAHIAPMSPRFGMLPQPALPTIARSQGLTQTVGSAPSTDRATTIAHPAVRSGDPWSRFGSANSQTVTVVHTVNGTQTLIGSSGGTKALVSNDASLHRDTGANAWSRFETMGGTKATTTAPGTARTTTGPANGWTTPVVHTTTNAPVMQHYGDPGLYRVPAAPYARYVPNGYSPGHNTQWMTPRSYMPSPIGAGMNPGAGAGPAHGNGNAMPNGGGSAHSGGH
jgi:hypothetical protein